MAKKSSLNKKKASNKELKSESSNEEQNESINEEQEEEEEEREEKEDKEEIENEEEEEEEKEEEDNSKINKGREIQNEKGITSPTSTGVIYVGHLPWGFIDSTLKKYFSQFGNITRIISPKSSKTGRSVGYAFIEFEDEETARIAAKTMNNYILFEKILKCNFVEDKSKYDRLFLKWKKKFELKDRYKLHCEKISKPKSKEEIKTMIQGLLDREEKRREKMKELGIKYEYKGYKEIIDEYKKEHINEIKEKNKEKIKDNKRGGKEEKNERKGKFDNKKNIKNYKKIEDDNSEKEENENEEYEESEKEEKLKKIPKKDNKKSNKKIETVNKQKKLKEIEKIQKKKEIIKPSKIKNRKK